MLNQNCDVDILPFAGAFSPDRGFGDCVGGRNDGRRGTGFHHGLADRFCAREAHRAAAVIDRQTDLPQHVVGSLAHVVVVIGPALLSVSPAANWDDLQTGNRAIAWS